MGHSTPRHHFLFLFAASRGARFFFGEEALQQGCSVTALCRAVDSADVRARMQALLDKTTFSHGNIPFADTLGTIQAVDRNIFELYAG